METKSKIVDDFLKLYIGLSNQEKLQVGSLFKEITGGNLSIYTNPVPVVVALIEIEGGGLLGIRRGTQPSVGGICLPGGYQESLEDARFAISREVLEETGLDTDPYKYFIFGNPLINNKNNQLIFFKYEKIISKDSFLNLQPTIEATSYELIFKDTEVCFPLHRKKINDFFR